MYLKPNRSFAVFGLVVCPTWGRI